MLRELGQDDYPKVMHTFNGLRNQVVVGSVIEGNTHGDIYVNDLENPTFVVLWDKMDAILLDGALNDDDLKSFAHLVSTVFMPDAKRRSFPLFNIYYPNETWARVIEYNLGNLHPIKELKYYYEFDKLKMDWKSTTQDNCVVKRINEHFLQQKDVENIDQITGWIGSFWTSQTKFIDRGIGYCLLQNETIVSWCLSVFVSGHKHELAIETIKDHRGKGHAKVVSSASVEYCIKLGLEPIWNCDAANVASMRVAEEIGFKKIKEYRVWQVILT